MRFWRVGCRTRHMLWRCHLTLCDRVSPDRQDCSLISLFFFSPSPLAVSSSYQYNLSLSLSLLLTSH
ncbi:hypothetical protein ACN38_g5367 [Penicillium nordicum]|uniref:Uncharacterized protein n=1 Tax=Penicillium nordicum TaxID=229535 RepID=A0A0M9WGA3_9EURO|nr:hypothetical protein ACN38_g5367 [Penicillium nordicum]